MTSLGKFAAVVLAAGASRRLPGEAKLLKRLQGRPLLAHCLDIVTSLDLSQVVVVVRPDADAITRLLASWPVDCVTNDDPDMGLGSSIATGIARLPKSVSGAFVVLGDMPFVDAEAYRNLVQEFGPTGHKTIGVPCFCGRMGHPVLFGREHFAELRQLRSDVGGRSLIESHKNNVYQVAVDDEHVLIDLDRADDFRRWDRSNDVVDGGRKGPATCEHSHSAG